MITHAHIDLTGRLPLRAQRGCAGPSCATPATIELTDIVSRDAAHIRMSAAVRYDLQAILPAENQSIELSHCRGIIRVDP